MKISFIGNGAMTKALAVNWQSQHDQFISGRSIEKSQVLAQQLNAKYGSVEEAIDFADVIVLAVPAAVAVQTMADYAKSHGFKNKVIVDISNPISTETFTSTIESRTSITEILAKQYPKASFGKAFNMAHTSVWENPDKMYSDKLMTVLFSADEVAATIIATLIRDLGAKPVMLGGNEHAYQLEAAAAIVIKFLFSGADGSTILNLVSKA
jgi:predicted dinucleotide-binding enzyme